MVLYLGPDISGSWSGPHRQSVWWSIRNVCPCLRCSLAIRVKARAGEGVDQMMRRFKKLCEKEGLVKDVKRKEFFEKPSERRRRAARKGVMRNMRTDMPIRREKPE